MTVSALESSLAHYTGHNNTTLDATLQSSKSLSGRQTHLVVIKNLIGMTTTVTVTRLRLFATLLEELGMFSASAPQIYEHRRGTDTATDQIHEIVTGRAEITMIIAVATTMTRTTSASATDIEIVTNAAITIITDTNAQTQWIAAVRGTTALNQRSARVTIVNTTDRTLTIDKETLTATGHLTQTRAAIKHSIRPTLQQSFWSTM